MAELQEFPDDFDSVLCIVAHPDDLEFGAASAIAKWTAAGKQVAYVLVTSGEAGIDGLSPEECGPIREAEERAGAEIVGVSSVEFLDHVDGARERGERGELAFGTPDTWVLWNLTGGVNGGGIDLGPVGRVVWAGKSGDLCSSGHELEVLVFEMCLDRPGRFPP